ncbi:MAG: hypothetical protein GQ574_08380 [Crocinitomix sp.]|nr:hypothetical protein [Crocinitomix sp.]
MKLRRESLYRTLVIIHEKDNESNYGSGVSLSVSNSSYIYVLTSRHVLDEIDDVDIEIYFIDEKKGTKKGPIKFLDKIDTQKADLAVLIVDSYEFNEVVGFIPPSFFVLSKLYYGKEQTSLGFPLLKLEQSKLKNSQTFTSYLESDLRTNFLFENSSKNFENMNTSSNNAVQNLSGVSGAGIFLQNNNNYMLGGIIKELGDENGTWGNFNGVKIADLLDDLLGSNYPKPMYSCTCFLKKQYPVFTEAHIDRTYSKIDLIEDQLVDFKKNDSRDVALLDILKTPKDNESSNGKKILIIDEGGMGKSHELKFIVDQMSSQTTDSFPIFINATHLASESLSNRIQNAYSDIDEIAKHHKVIVFIDGLDEVPKDSLRSTLDAIEIFVTDFREYSYIITSRTKTFYLSNSIQNKLINILKFERYDLTPITDLDLKLFAKGKLRERAVNFWKEIEKNGLNELMLNPFYFIETLQLFEKNIAVSGKNTILKAIIEKAIEKDIQNKFQGILSDSELRNAQKALLKTLQKLALIMRMNGKNELHFDSLQELNFDEEYIKHFQLLNIHQDQIKFKHQLINEYLCGITLHEGKINANEFVDFIKADYEQDATNILLKHLKDTDYISDEWFEIISFYHDSISQNERIKLVEIILEIKPEALVRIEQLDASSKERVFEHIIRRIELQGLIFHRSFYDFSKTVNCEFRFNCLLSELSLLVKLENIDRKSIAHFLTILTQQEEVCPEDQRSNLNDILEFLKNNYLTDDYILSLVITSYSKLEFMDDYFLSIFLDLERKVDLPRSYASFFLLIFILGKSNEYGELVVKAVKELEAGYYERLNSGGSSNSSDLSIYLNMCVNQLDEIKSFKALIQFYTENRNNYINCDPLSIYIERTEEKIISKLKLIYNKDNDIITDLSMYLGENARYNFNSFKHLDPIVNWIKNEKLVAKVYTILSARTEKKWHFARMVTPLYGQDLENLIISDYKVTKDSELILNMYRAMLRLNESYANSLIDRILNFDSAFSDPRNEWNEHEQKVTESFQSTIDQVLDKKNFIVQLEEFVSDYENRDLSDFFSDKRLAKSEFDFAFDHPIYATLHFLRNNSDGFDSIGIIEFINHVQWDDFVTHLIYFAYNDKLERLSDSQKAEIIKWILKNQSLEMLKRRVFKTSNSKIIFEWSQILEVELESETYLDFINFDLNINEKQSMDTLHWDDNKNPYAPFLKYIESKTSRDKIITKVIDDIENLFEDKDTLVYRHLKYIEYYKIDGVISNLKDFILNSESSWKTLAIEVLFKLSSDELKVIFRDIDIAVADNGLILLNKIDSDWVNKFLKEAFADPSVHGGLKLHLAEQLIAFGDVDAMEYFTNNVIATNHFKNRYYPQPFLESTTIKEFFTYFIQLLEVSQKPEFTDENSFRSLKQVCIDSLSRIASEFKMHKELIDHYESLIKEGDHFGFLKNEIIHIAELGLKDLMKMPTLSEAKTIVDELVGH